MSQRTERLTQTDRPIGKYVDDWTARRARKAKRRSIRWIYLQWISKQTDGQTEIWTVRGAIGTGSLFSKL